MPRLTRLFIKTGLVYLVLAFAIGVLQGATGRAWAPELMAHLRPVYFHLFMVGWVTQLIFGVGHWMFPRYTKERPRGSEMLAWSVYWLLNIGLAMRLVSEPLYGLTGGVIWSWALVFSAILQWLAGVVFAANSWPRLREL